MNLIYNNINIINDVLVTKAVINDNSGGIADSIEIEFSDSKCEWRNWNVKKNDTLILEKGRFKSGIMFIDSFGINKGKFRIYAKSVPLKAKEQISKPWENISFMHLANELASILSLELKTYFIKDITYKTLDMSNRTPLGFLNELCILEGYSVKVTNKSLVIFDERELEKYPSIRTLSAEDFEGDYDFYTKSNDLYSSCLIKSFEESVIQYEFKCNVIGPRLIKTFKVENIGQAERYAKNLLRNTNKFETTGTFKISLDDELAAGNTIDIDISDFSGKYFIYSIRNDLINNKSILKVYKIMEGY